VDDQPGVTRIGFMPPWSGRQGIDADRHRRVQQTDEDPARAGQDQVMKAIEESDRILFMVDGREGMMPGIRKLRISSGAPARMSALR